MTPPIRLDHCVVHVADWERSNAFYRDVVGAELVRVCAGWAYRFGPSQLNLHGPGVDATPVARLPVQPGNSDLCFVWSGPIEDAAAHLQHHGIPIELGPVPRRRRPRYQRILPRPGRLAAGVHQLYGLGLGPIPRAPETKQPRPLPQRSK